MAFCVGRSWALRSSRIGIPMACVAPWLNLLWAHTPLAIAWNPPKSELQIPVALHIPLALAWNPPKSELTNALLGRVRAPEASIGRSMGCNFSHRPNVGPSLRSPESKAALGVESCAEDGVGIEIG
eukprot:8341529-Alexandrium_andersonii.AAC.1